MSDRRLNGQIEFDIVAVSDAEAEGEMTVTPSGSGLYAGALIWFAEAVATSLVLGGEPVAGDAEGLPVAVSLSAQMPGHCRNGTLVAKARWVSRGPRVAIVRTEIRDPEGGLLLDLTSTHLASAAAKPA
ncbi:PaaI family thioesterase [Paracoccus spongiarum]|uniref:PaaI family thioesterase n=1 Tax=Paracoccus spongiarum TaxID=3064387 RepID=A0ABT9JD57_9RHOB|nr:PaaI family thioesterase [Paracoccus sp. 2205BS29-5]MDP5307750.1 PaaI family thioesterase [Paracoccus sp. 2205BS29-5]